MQSLDSDSGIVQSLDYGYSFVQTPETVIVSPNMCTGVPLLLHIESRCPFLVQLPQIEFLALHILAYSLVQLGAPQ